MILTNNTEARMKFSVRTQQPFEIIKMVARRPMDEVDDEGEAPSSELLPVRYNIMFIYQLYVTIDN